MAAADRLSPGPNRSDAIEAPARIRVGTIAGAHGLNGALRLRPDNPDSQSLDQVTRVFIEHGGEPPREFRLRGCARINRTTLRVMVAGLEDREQAEALKGATLSVARDDLPAREPGEFYYFEAIGCAVETLEGRPLGTIAEVFATGANEVWVVRDGDREVLIPVIAEVVRSLDLAARRIVIEAVPGLLD